MDAKDIVELANVRYWTCKIKRYYLNSWVSHKVLHIQSRTFVSP